MLVIYRNVHLINCITERENGLNRRAPWPKRRRVIEIGEVSSLTLGSANPDGRSQRVHVR